MDQVIDVAGQVGLFVGRGVISIAGVLRQDEAPGFVVVLLAIGLLVALSHLCIRSFRRRKALKWIQNIILSAASEKKFNSREEEFGSRIEDVDRLVREGEKGAIAERLQVINAWNEYKETLITYDQDGASIQRNSVRPNVFFNIDDLQYGQGFWRILPGLFVTIGLFLTFLGLISALDSMGHNMQESGEISQTAMTDLLTVASAKFIMSLTGLACSIVFTVALRWQIGSIEAAIHRLCKELENRLSFISLEDLAVEQLKVSREQKDHFKRIGTELVAELARPLREELPQAISNSISTAMAPLLEQVGKMSSDGVGSMVKDLSSQMSDDVGRALSQASDRLGEAGDRIGSLVERMDRSSGQMGSEMEAAIARLGQALDDLRGTMQAGAEATTGAFNQGAEQILAAMNETLQGIRQNTGEGAQAIADAAAEMRKAAEGIRTELEAATHSGSDAARTQMAAAGNEVSAAISQAGADISRVTQQVAEKAGEELIEPISELAEQLDELVSMLSEGSVEMKRAADNIRAGATASGEAASAFRSTSESLLSAAVPIRDTVQRLEVSTVSLADSTRHVADSTRNSASSTENILQSAREALGGQQRAIEATLEALSGALERMEGQGDRLDEMDEKLGAAFDIYTSQVNSAVNGLHEHVQRMQQELSPALDTMRTIVEQAEEFAPQSRRN